MDISKVQNILFFAIMIFVFLLFLYLLSPFFFPIFWAAVISSIFSPLYKLLNRKLHKPNVSATDSFSDSCCHHNSAGKHRRQIVARGIHAHV